METIELFAVEIYGDGSFYPGEVIYGDVYLKTNEELTVREIRIELYGEAKVFWSEAARKKRLGMRDYTNYEQYLNIAATVLWQRREVVGKILDSFSGIEKSLPGQIGANPVLSPGEHSFPFEFRLPEENLPTTFEGKHGHVKYWLKAILDRPWKDDMKIIEPFTVTEKMDVNQPEFLRPSQVQEDRNMGCLCCVSGPLSVTVRTDRGAYCTGELMPVTVYANNQTSHRILGVELELIQDTIFIASGGKRTFTTEIIATVTKAGKIPNAEGNDFFEMVPILIPSLTPTMRSSRCIKISYQIKFALLLRGSVNFRLHLPITIGSLPCQPSQSRRSSSRASGSSISPSITLMGFPSTSLDYTDGMTSCPNEAPPSYAESVRGQTRRYDTVYYNKGMDTPQLSNSVKKSS
ncbi:hypothetical protein OS493_019020 [Desmophyllum pertusum]|uniref:Arrestin C-terminal-like domain-containing protein n=1 Tax=Desmophyllum pertusum TaxID=174260 RepID=A0A9W9YZS2_9CNID|nr:hypothetical protein OS493_019020 [Desmophyllum pertusum]